jgi:hypothetical protein
MLTVDENWPVIIKHEVLASGTDNLFEICQWKSHYCVPGHYNLSSRCRGFREQVYRPRL